MDKEALERSLARRLLDHIENGTTDLADEILELPTDTYRKARHDEEVEALFLDHPLVFALSGALPGPNTYRSVDLAGTPVLITRDADGRVHAFANICRHRGVRLVDGGGSGRKFACPFHAWVYNVQGDLTSIPSEQFFSGFCKEDNGLVRLPVTEGYGLIVGNLRPGPDPDIDAYLGPDLAGELAELAFADWTVLGEPHRHPVQANWKVTLDTFRENYHFAFLHRKTLAQYAVGGVLTFDPFGHHLRNVSALKSITALQGVPEEDWGDVTQHFSLQYQLFPNTSLTFDSRHAELWQIVPVDERTSEVWHTSYRRPDLSQEETAKLVEMAPWICETVVDGEDFWVAGRSEPNLHTGLLDRVVFGRNEPAPQHLHHGFDEVLAEHRAQKVES